MKAFLVRSVAGILLGAFLTIVTVFGLVLIGGQETLDGALLIKNALGMMLAGWFFSVSSLYFEIETFELPMQTTLHFITVTALYFILAFGIGWFPVDTKSVLTAIAIFLAVYAVIWISFYFYFKNQSRKLNEELKNL